ncbi:MAG: DUF5522 domain-containing protein [Saprospiraceae bacterium]|nr:DUF5522 domain-containing protein [Saprospiraceae bacterium]
MSSDKKDDKKPSPGRLEEGLDYYLENGKYVFTRHFLLRRGYCCESGCRHCPYGFSAGEESSQAS